MDIAPVEFVQRREIGKVERIAFVIGEADPVIDRDDELLRMVWFGRGERIVGTGGGYGGRLDHLAIGRASVWERVFRVVQISGVAVSFKKRLKRSKDVVALSTQKQ